MKQYVYEVLQEASKKTTDSKEPKEKAKDDNVVDADFEEVK